MRLQVSADALGLPYEPWLECLAYAVVDSPEGALPWLAVSTCWQETILSSPDLWTNIIIDSGHDEISRFQTFLALSGHRLLHVRITRPRYSEEVLRCVLKEGHRIASFCTLELDSAWARGLAGPFTSEASVYPELEVLEVPWKHLEDTYKTSIWKLCPKVSKLGPLVWSAEREAELPETLQEFRLPIVYPNQAYSFSHRGSYLRSLDLNYSPRPAPSTEEEKEPLPWPEHLKQVFKEISQSLSWSANLIHEFALGTDWHKAVEAAGQRFIPLMMFRPHSELVLFVRFMRLNSSKGCLVPILS